MTNLDPIQREEFFRSWNVTFVLCTWHIDGQARLISQLSDFAPLEADEVSFEVPGSVGPDIRLAVGVFRDDEPWKWLEVDPEAKAGDIVTAYLSGMERAPSPDGGWSASIALSLQVSA